MRALLVAGLLLVAGCTTQPASAPPNSTVLPTSTTPSEAEQPSEKRSGCPDVIPSDVISDLAGEPIDGAAESVDGNTVRCQFRGMVVSFTTGSDEKSFAQRRAERPHETRNEGLERWTEVPDFYDEAYRAHWGAESMSRNYIAARQGPVEVWLDWGVATPAEKPDFRERLFATVFERVAAPATSTQTPWTVPSFTNDPGYLGCPDVVPSDVVTEIVGVTTPGAWESRVDGWIGCPFYRWEVGFTVESDEESFAQRRDQRTSGRYTQLPDFYDEAYEYLVGAESVTQTVVVARQGHNEVQLKWHQFGSGPDIAAVRDELFAAIFERLG